jgi:ASC-1-like (ASCH) protein
LKVHEAGIKSSILADIKSGHKTIEARLAKGKFLDFKAGDRLRLREDFYENDRLVRSISNQGLAEVTKVELYPSFKVMLKSVGIKNVLPWASSVKEALSEFRKFYSLADEENYGVLAIHFKLIR